MFVATICWRNGTVQSKHVIEDSAVVEVEVAKLAMETPSVDWQFARDSEALETPPKYKVISDILPWKPWLGVVWSEPKATISDIESI